MKHGIEFSATEVLTKGLFRGHGKTISRWRCRLELDFLRIRFAWVMTVYSFFIPHLKLFFNKGKII